MTADDNYLPMEHSMFTKTYSFAGHAVSITAECGFADTAETAQFLIPTSPHTDIDITAAICDNIEPPPPDHTLLGGRVAMWRVGNDIFRAGFTFGQRAGNDEPITLSRRRGNRVWVLFAASRVGRFDARMILEAAGLADIMIDLGAAVLHSSFVLHGGQALIFCGPSGAGKSTQAELWRRHIGAEVINGDRTLITPTPDGADANGIVYCGTSGICRNRTAPIRAIILISHGEENTLASAAPRDAFRALLSQMTFNIGDPAAVAEATAICADIVSRVPIIRFSCLPNESAVRFLQNYLGRTYDEK